jgi:NAD(P)-dependent dehydrogenase (short-subunit alcohol dehydrogenase family)
MLTWKNQARSTKEHNMRIADSVALVTGSNRGLGRAFAAELLARGAKVYATARDPEKIDLPGAVPLRLDVTDRESIAAAAAIATDVDLLVNNAGNASFGNSLTADPADLQALLDTHVFGPLHTTRAFAPVLAANGGGAVLNVLSVLSWFNGEDLAYYSVAKSAAWSLTNSLRQSLAGQGTQVTALHVGYMDTDMAAHVDPAGKIDPAGVAALALDGVQAGDFEVLADELSRNVQAGLAHGVAALYPQLAATGA